MIIFKGHQYRALTRQATATVPDLFNLTLAQWLDYTPPHPAPGYRLLYHGTSDRNAAAIVQEGLLQRKSKSPPAGSIWATTDASYGGTLVVFQVPVDDPYIEYAATEGHHAIITRDVAPEDILEIDLNLDQYGIYNRASVARTNEYAEELYELLQEDFWHDRTAATPDQDYHDVGFTETGRWGNAGSGCLFTTGERILLLERSWDVEEPGTWGLPGGAIPEDCSGACPDALESALQETKEELGSVPPHKVVDQYVYQEPGFQYTTFICQVDEPTTETNFVLNWENDNFGWFSRRELASLDLHFGVEGLLEHLDPFALRQASTRVALTPQQKTLKRQYQLEQQRQQDKIPTFEEVWQYQLQYGDLDEHIEYYAAEFTHVDADEYDVADWLEEQNLLPEEPEPDTDQHDTWVQQVQDLTSQHEETVSEQLSLAEAKAYLKAEVEGLYDDAVARVEVGLDQKTCWRAMMLPVNLDPATHQGIGTYWAFDEGSAEAHWGGQGHRGKETQTVVYSARIDQDNIDQHGTILANTDYSIGETEAEVSFHDGATIWVYSVELEDGTVIEINDWRRT